MSTQRVYEHLAQRAEAIAARLRSIQPTSNELRPLQVRQNIARIDNDLDRIEMERVTRDRRMGRLSPDDPNYCVPDDRGVNADLIE